MFLVFSKYLNLFLKSHFISKISFLFHTFHHTVCIHLLHTPVQDAYNTLSFSELEAIIHIFDELDGEEGILVASKIADRVGITRSVIVNALRKFESAGVIESRSSGMKGTYIKVVNDYVFKELDKIKKEKMN